MDKTGTLDKFPKFRHPLQWKYEWKDSGEFDFEHYFEREEDKEKSSIGLYFHRDLRVLTTFFLANFGIMV